MVHPATEKPSKKEKKGGEREKRNTNDGVVEIVREEAFEERKKVARKILGPSRVGGCGAGSESVVFS